jgi:hypothetical protein
VCASIGRAAGKIKSVKGMKMLKSYYEAKYFDVPMQPAVLNMVKGFKAAKMAFEKAAEPFGTKAKWTAKQREISKKDGAIGTPSQKKAVSKMKAGIASAKKTGVYKKAAEKRAEKKSMGTGAGMGGAGVVGVGMGTANQSASYRKKHGTKIMKKGVKMETGKEYIDRGYNQTTEAKVTEGYPKGESQGMPKAGGTKGTNAERGANAYSEAKATQGYPKGVSHGMKADKSVKVLDGKEYIDRSYNASSKAKVEAGYPQGAAKA